MGTWLCAHRTLNSSVVAAAAGALAWSGQPVMLSLSFIFLPLLTAQSSRKSAYAVALSYHAASSWSLVRGAHAFFGHDSNLFAGVLLWATASLLLASPWSLFHFTTWPARFCSVPMALLATTLPPLGIIGWASPLTGAGILFPGTGWPGIIVLSLLPAFIFRHPRLIPAAAALVALVNLAYRGDPSPPAGWEAVDTAFGRSEIESPDPIREFQNAQWIQQRSLNSDASVIIFPETVIPRWNEAVELFWEPTLKQLAKSGKTIALGATLTAMETRLPVNAVIICGPASPALFLQRIPPPISMWRPFTHSGFPLRLTGVSTVVIARERPAFLICYELLLVWPVLSANFDHPTILVGLANDYWARGTPIPAVQRAALIAWARLFCLPQLMAVNA